ncbi:MAG: DUF4837 family protein [Prevotella sp.]|nr:DUF4837 family protein [Prevotella sp.]
MKHLLSIILLALTALTLASCDESTGKPESSNRPYQVLLVGDRDDILYHELTAPVKGLPQPEPHFDVTSADDIRGTNAPWQKLTRSIVAVVIDKRAKDTHMALQRDVYAKPQLILTITAPSVASLRRYVADRRGSICRILDAFELGCQKHALKTHHNEDFDKKIHLMFGIDMLIPVEMQSSKEGKDFLWLSNNQNEGLQNICVYRVKDNGRSFLQVRDSVMKANIPGEKDGMYMETTAVCKDNAYKGTAFYRGIWDMKGDAMGGPFIAIELRQASFIIYIEGFVYAPEDKKRNKVRELEAVLYTAKATGQDKK